MNDKIKCPKCGFDNIPDSFMCSNCGSSLESTPVAITEPSSEIIKDVVQTPVEINEVLSENNNVEVLEEPLEVLEEQTTEVLKEETLEINTEPISTEETITSTSEPVTEQMTNPTTEAITELTTETLTEAKIEATTEAVTDNSINLTQTLATEPITEINPSNINSIPGFENFNPQPIPVKKSHKKLLLIPLILLILGGLGFFAYKNIGIIMNNVPVAKGSTIDKEGKIHKVGEKAEVYDKSFAEKVKYLLSSQQCDSKHNMFFSPNDVRDKKGKLFFQDGTILEETLEEIPNIYYNYIMIRNKETNVMKVYNCYGEIVMEDTFDYDDTSKTFIKDDQYYNINGKIGDDNTEVHLQGSSRVYLLFIDKKNNKKGVIDYKGKILDESTSTDFYLLPTISAPANVNKSFAIRENGTYKIISGTTGKVLYESKEELEMKKTNFYSIKNEEDSYHTKYIYVNEDKVIYEGEPNSIDGDELVRMINDKVYYNGTGKELPDDTYPKMDEEMESVYLNDEITITLKDIKYGFRYKGKTISESEYPHMSFFIKNINDELKTKNKAYFPYYDSSERTGYIIDLKTNKRVYENVVFSELTPLIYTNDEEEKKTIISLINGKAITVEGEVKIGFNCIMVTKDNNKKYYNNVLKEVYEESV